MKKCLFLFAAIFFCQFINAQALVIRDITGIPIEFDQYLNINGSPFLYDEWHKGSVVFTNGQTSSDLQLKYDQVRDALVFKGENGKPLFFTNPVQRFTLLYYTPAAIIEKTYQNGFPATRETSPISYFEVLANGKKTLLKRTKKNITDYKEYNSATANKTITENVNYYISASYLLTPIKKDKKSILVALADKKAEVESFIKKNSLNLREEEDLIKLLTYYNSL